MADTKISALTALLGTNVDKAADFLAIVDTSVTTTKKILVSELFATNPTFSAGLVIAASQALTGTVANSTISGFLSVAATTGTFTNIAAHTLTGTISGGGNQINNVIIGTTTPLAGSFTTLSSSTANAGGLTQEAITAPSLQNSWTNVGGAYETAGYWKDSMGVVHVRGVITGGTTAGSTLIFTLGAGYRPVGTSYYGVASGGYGYLIVLSNGEVRIGSVVSAEIEMNFSFRVA